MSIELESLKREVVRLQYDRLKDAENHEEAMRCMIKMLSKRGDVIRNLRSRAENWKTNAVRLAVRNTSLRRYQINAEFMRRIGW